MSNRKSRINAGALVAGCIGLITGQVAGAQSPTGSQSDSSPAAESTAAPAKAAPKHPAVKPTAAASASAAPKPVMGLRVPLTAGPPTPKGAKALPKDTTAGTPSLYRNTKPTEKAEKLYAGVWGVDKLRATYTNSGNLIRFSYRVLEPKLAKTLGDHANEPQMVGVRSNAVLHVPNMEKIGELRQKSAAEANKEYWMVFSNKGNLIKPGDEVSVVIGKFHADGLIVEASQTQSEGPRS